MEPICVRQWVDQSRTVCGREARRVGTVSALHYQTRPEHIASLVMCHQCTGAR